MHLFSKEKDLIHRVANLILILWLVIAIFIMYNSFINTIIKEPILTYDEYKIENCGQYIPKNEYDDEDFCPSQYEQYKFSRKNNEYYNKKNLINSLGNVIIVGTFIFLLNKKRNFN
ncbi:MAG: hypothetical protein GX247_04710 [Mollicutes bacterium]|nr:hypothetical protein [Mollicutes bacterium]